MHGDPLGPPLTRADLSGPGIAILNLGGFANPDVLLVRRAGVALVVKDWSRRSAWVRALIAPLLARHEAAMLARADGIPGVPRLVARIDRLAFAMEFVEGRALRRRAHGRALPGAFFAALEAILAELAARGMAYLDLRSPTNVLVTPGGAPALVDLGSALWLPLPGAWILRFERRALAKLRSRFERRSDGERATPDGADDMSANLKVADTRICLREHGSLDDPVPAVFLPEAGFSSRWFAPALAAAGARGRRAIGIDPPGFGSSRGDAASLDPARIAEQLEVLLDALRISRVDVVGAGWGARIGAALASRSPARVRRLVAIRTEASGDADDPREPEALRARLEASLPNGLPAELRATLAAELARVSSRSLALAFAASDAQPTPIGVRGPERIELDASRGADPERIWSALDGKR